MLQVKDLPDAEILKKFAQRYPDADIARVLQFLTLLRVASDLSNGLDQFLATYDLLQGRWWVLLLLMREDDFSSSPSKLADKAGVSRATMTGLIDGLQRDGLVKRITDNKDRRQTLVRLTRNGQKKLDEVMPDYYQRLNELMSVLSEEQGDQLITMLTQLNTQRHIFD
ncbi:MarR family winged helix-turn-helix transcriptional regulator [Methylophaga sp. OBS4]|uniref:MarR family winged helix-turn-helix transcriptional regulator n=1 Tax=Methylophaga sp. OBS4 TaxID=2991935 RepID=UPI00225BBDBC|nr:MarR family transcriptional regulator [Methylophaga sp. OBS4]MCX4188109.1 MarR family transcriptional regulator [Methylophaga sp. OBS4]